MTARLVGAVVVEKKWGAAKATSQTGSPLRYAPTLQRAARTSAPQAEALNQLLISRRVLPAQVIEQAAPLAHDLEQPPARVVIFLVGFEMIRETVDPLGEQRNLNFGRTGITFMGAVRVDDGALGLGAQQRELL